MKSEVRKARDREPRALKHVLEDAANYVRYGVPMPEPLRSYVVNSLWVVGNGYDLGKVFKWKRKRGAPSTTLGDQLIFALVEYFRMQGMTLESSVRRSMRGDQRSAFSEAAECIANGTPHAGMFENAPYNLLDEEQIAEELPRLRARLSAAVDPVELVKERHKVMHSIFDPKNPG